MGGAEKGTAWCAGTTVLAYLPRVSLTTVGMMCFRTSQLVCKAGFAFISRSQTCRGQAQTRAWKQSLSPLRPVLVPIQGHNNHLDFLESRDDWIDPVNSPAQLPVDDLSPLRPKALTRLKQTLPKTQVKCIKLEIFMTKQKLMRFPEAYESLFLRGYSHLT